MQKTPVQLLQEIFGYNAFRGQQEEIIQHALSGKDTLVLMPTGGGKSICFQIPSLLINGITLVVSPLISLMQDQVQALEANGIPSAFVNSTQTAAEKDKIRQRAMDGELKLLYAAPETIFSSAESWITELDIRFVAIDEAHCVSMWGHDFRPEYTYLNRLRIRFAQVPFMALTATADKHTRRDIVHHLGLKEAKTFLSSFDRPNLQLTVRGNLPKAKKMGEIVAYIKIRKEETGIIYCLSRKETEDMAFALIKQGINASYYHAGMKPEERAKVQNDFLFDKTQVICATIAFGMGIDKSNVRYVIHNNLPKNLEGYYQEIGRAGRDGLPAEARLYYNYRDVKLLSDFASQSEQSEVLLEKLNRMLEFAEAEHCRRKILLSYFSESLEDDCHNCDVCSKPPKYFDGTKLAQMALSGVKRCQEQISSLLLIDLIRGAKTTEIFERKMNELKTYGIGAKQSWKEWSHYLTAMKNQGVFEIAYHEKMHLKITTFGEDILYGRKELKLSYFIENKDAITIAPKAPSHLDFNEMLFDRLRLLRKKIAVEENVPPYIIFSDATLKDMAQRTPRNTDEFELVSGVGTHKASKYGPEFIELIKAFLNQNTSGKKPKESTYDKTLELFQLGKSIPEISAIRALSTTTVLSHLAQLYLENKWTDIDLYVSTEEVEKVRKAVEVTGEKVALKPIYEFLGDELEYGKIRLAMAYLTKEESLVS
ncbi:MAG: DNA helicase RecQ [Crocinitomicaceae bacterium]